MWRCLTILILLTPGAVGENQGIFLTLNGTYADSVHDLPANINPVPEKMISKHNDIEGWVDIVGFRNMVRINGIDYVAGNPAEYAEVRYDARFDVDNISSCKLSTQSCIVNSISNDMSVSQEGNNTTVATANVTVRWRIVRTPCTGSRCVYKYTSRASFKDYEKSPQTYGLNPKDVTVFVTEYNNTISPKVSISVPGQGKAVKTTIRYRDDTARHSFMLGTVSYTEKNIPYLDMAVVDYWNVSVSTDMKRMGSNVLINGTTLDYSELNVSVSTPFGTFYANNYTIHKLDYSPEKTWNPVFFAVLGTVGILGYGINRFWKVIF